MIIVIIVIMIIVVIVEVIIRKVDLRCIRRRGDYLRGRVARLETCQESNPRSLPGIHLLGGGQRGPPEFEHLGGFGCLAALHNADCLGQGRSGRPTIFAAITSVWHFFAPATRCGAHPSHSAGHCLRSVRFQYGMSLSLRP